MGVSKNKSPLFTFREEIIDSLENNDPAVEKLSDSLCHGVKSFAIVCICMENSLL